MFFDDVVKLAIKTVIGLTIVAGVVLLAKQVDFSALPAVAAQAPLPWEMWDGAISVEEHHDIAGHQVWVIRFVGDDAPSFTDLCKFISHMLKASQLEPDHAMYLHFLKMNSEDGKEYVFLSLTVREDQMMAFAATPADEETAEYKLGEDSIGLTMRDYWGLGIRPVWVCGSDDTRCAGIYSWTLAILADHQWAAELKPEAEE